jgi:hypothetical protein
LGGGAYGGSDENIGIYDKPAAGRVVDGIDLMLLGKALGSIDQMKTKKAKDLYNRLYHEALISAEPGRGISFTDMLVLLAHYKLIDDDKALQSVLPF